MALTAPCVQADLAVLMSRPGGGYRAHYGCVLAGVEALVGWLLDHADTPGTDLSDPDTGSEDGSDEELLEDLDDTAYALVSAP